jgi:O-antigen/teichoic acid export membrane protein
LDALKRAKRTVFTIMSKYVPRRALRAGSLGIVDQAVISGANFAFMIVAARHLGPAAFGLFALFYLILGLIESVQDSLITTPHTVISASKNEDTYRIYTSSVAIVQFTFAGISAGVIVLASVVALVLSSTLVPVILALAFTSFASLTQQFTRRVLYTESRFGAALIQDVLAHGLRLLMLAALMLSVGLSEFRLFIIVGVAFLIGSMYGIWQIRGSFARSFDRGVVRQHWRFGNWLAASKVASMVPHYVTAALLSATLSVSAYGAYRAALQLVHGANVLLEASNNLVRPRLARDAQSGPEAVTRTMRPIMLVGGVALSVFGAFLILFREPLLNLIYGSQFAPYAAVMFLLAVKPLVDLLKDLLSNALLAFHETRAIFIRTVIGSLAGIGLGGISVLAFGLPAAGAVTLFGAVASVLWLIWAWRQRVGQGTEPVKEGYPGSERVA